MCARAQSQRPSLDRVNAFSLRRLLRRLIVRNRAAIAAEPEAFRPQVRPLEPRLVLNATAELTALGLFVTGTDGAESVDLDVDSAGELLLRDGGGTVIPITNHPDGPGAETSPLNPADVTGGQIVFDMLGGDDQLDLELPTGLDVSVLPSLGDDSTTLEFGSAGSSNGNLVTVDSDTIEFGPQPRVALGGDTLDLTGSVVLGNSNTATQVDLATGSFTVDGDLLFAGDVSFVGANAAIDFSSSTLSAFQPGTLLQIDLAGTGSLALLGDADASAGDLIQDVSILRAGTVAFDGQAFEVAGQIAIDGVADSVEVNADLVSQSTVIQSDQAIDIQAPITSDRIRLAAGDQLVIGDDLEASTGGIELSSSDIALRDVDVRSSGGNIGIDGDVEIEGTVLFDSGRATQASIAGQIQFFDTISSTGSGNDTLRVDARGADVDGTVTFSTPFGSLSEPTAEDLNGLEVLADRIEINSVRVVGGVIDLQATETTLSGNLVETVGDGDIQFDTALRLPVNQTDIRSAGSVTLAGRVQGQVGTGDLNVSAGDDATIAYEVSLPQSLDLSAGGTARIDGTVNLGESLDLTASTVRIAADITTSGSGVASDVIIRGNDLVIVENDAVVDSRAGQIRIDAGAGRVDTSDGNLVGNRATEAIVVTNASSIQLGDTSAASGTLRLSEQGGAIGLVTQAGGTTITADRFVAITESDINLSNVGNEFRLIESVQAREVAITDSVGDLIVQSINSSGNDVDIRSSGDVFLFDSAIVAGDANASVTAGRTIADASGTDLPNLLAGDVSLVASAIGMDTNFVDILATSSVSANTENANGDVFIASIGIAMPIGLFNAGDGNVSLIADSINDASADDTVDLQSRRLSLLADAGIGNTNRLELRGLAELEAVTTDGGIDLALEATRATVVESLMAVTGDLRLTQEGLRDTAPLTLASVVAQDGAITVDAGGPLTAVDVVSENLSAIDDSIAGTTSRDVRLTTRGDQSDLFVGQVVAANSADVHLHSADDLFDTDLGDQNRIVADDLEIISANLTPDQQQAVDLSINVNDVTAIVEGPHRGDLRLTEVDDLRLASSDAMTDDIVHTENGEVVVRATGLIHVVDFDVRDEGPDLKLDPEVLAQGTNGRIDFQSDTEIRLDDAVQLVAEKQTVRTPMTFQVESAGENPQTTTEIRDVVSRENAAVFLLAGTTPDTGVITLGENIEINTGDDQGVARKFAPRPVDTIDFDKDADDNPETAFFDVGSVRTNILEQADVNNATGILTLDIGAEGERGLTVNIDWGAPTFRFQQIDGLSADAAYDVPLLVEGPGSDPDDGETRVVQAPVRTRNAPPLLNVEHKYTESNILFTRFNDRESETKPIEVRFSVRHHESIVVLGSTVQQAGATETLPPLPEESLPPRDFPATIGQPQNRVVSSTDNDAPTLHDPNRNLTHLNGEASFIIPNLSIPVAFFPVRDVIPDVEQPEFFVTTEASVALTDTQSESIESASSATVAREEYFRIRVLSPDPNAEQDLAEPTRLPNDILSGDKLQRLLKGSPEEGTPGLPDGRYEIEYVLGDGNERSIFRFDLRDGVPTSPSDGLDEGELKLEHLPTDLTAPSLPEPGKAASEDSADWQPPVLPEHPRPINDNATRDGQTAMVATTALLPFAVTKLKRKRPFSAAARFARGRDRQ